MGCSVCCRRGPELSRHLATCPFSDVSREREEKTRERWRVVVAQEVEQERARRVGGADSRFAVASAAARVARRTRRRTSLNRCQGEDKDRGFRALGDDDLSAVGLARLVRDHRDASLVRLGAELRNLRESQAKRSAEAWPARERAVQIARDAVAKAFPSFHTKTRPDQPTPTVEVFGSVAGRGGTRVILQRGCPRTRGTHGTLRVRPER